MPIQLPLAQPYVNLPPPPQDPPTIGDVMVAQRYHEQVDNLRRLRHGIGGPNQLNAAQAEIYKLEVIQAHRAERIIIKILPFLTMSLTIVQMWPRSGLFLCSGPNSHQSSGPNSHQSGKFN